MTIKPHEINVGDVLEKKDIVVRYVVTKIHLDSMMIQWFTLQALPEFGWGSQKHGDRIWVTPEYTHNEYEIAQLNLVKIKSLGENDD